MLNELVKKIKRHSYSIFTFAFISGFLLFSFYHQWIVIYFPFNKTYLFDKTSSFSQTKKVPLFFWKHKKWKSETVDILWAERPEKTIHHLLNAYFALLQEEDLIEEKVSVEDISISPHIKTIFISFDRSPFNKHNSIKEKLMIIEGALKTIRDNDLVFSHIYFLVHHKPLHDYHLDFTHPWALQGFID